MSKWMVSGCADSSKYDASAAHWIVTVLSKRKKQKKAASASGTLMFKERKREMRMTVCGNSAYGRAERVFL